MEKIVFLTIILTIIIIEIYVFGVMKTETEKCNTSQDLCSLEPYSSSTLCKGEINLSNNLVEHFNKYQNNNDWGYCTSLQ